MRRPDVRIRAAHLFLSDEVEVIHGDIGVRGILEGDLVHGPTDHCVGV